MTVRDSKGTALLGIADLNVVDPNGKPVTIPLPQLVYNSGITKVVPAKYIIELLKNHKANWEE